MASTIESTNSSQAGDITVMLIQQAETNRSDLVNRYHKDLRATLFTDRTDLHPSIVKNVAAEEVEALLQFLWSHSSSFGLERGAQLCQVGLSEKSVLSLNQVTRQFFIAHLEDRLIAPALDLLDIYQHALILGFMKNRETVILDEQDRIRKAFELTIRRYTVEIKEIQALAQRATEANEFKSRFMARVSHELRTPLGAILGMSEMLQHTVYGPLTPQQQDIVLRIINNVRSLERIFTEFLDQSQMETGQLKLRANQFSPQALAQTVYSNYLPMALQKGLAMHLQVDSRLPHDVVGDSKRTEQILTNLVVNAIKYTENGSITINLITDDAYWKMQVKDTGIGISEEAQKYIFEPFRQADETMERKYDGVGLGLAIVQQLVTAMRGAVSVESKIGQGSTFTVTLPLQEV